MQTINLNVKYTPTHAPCGAQRAAPRVGPLCHLAWVRRRGDQAGAPIPKLASEPQQVGARTPAVAAMQRVLCWDQHVTMVSAAVAFKHSALSHPPGRPEGNDGVGGARGTPWVRQARKRTHWQQDSGTRNVLP